MAVRGKISGRTQLREMAAKLAVEAPAKLEASLLKGTREALKPLKADLQAEAAAKMPKRGGYNRTLSRSIKVSTRVSGGKVVNATVTITASGKRENRDLPALNRGLLRHPLFGRRRHWYAQRVPRGVVDKPVDRTRDRVVEAARKAADDYVKTLAKG